MKNLDYFLKISSREKPEHLVLIENDVSGGRITTDTIDKINDNPKAYEITISGLTQDTFNYFIDKYAMRFKAINFWKCPLVHDLNKISQLNQVEYITYFWNQRAESFWDFSKTSSLKGFSFSLCQPKMSPRC